MTKKHLSKLCFAGHIVLYIIFIIRHTRRVTRALLLKKLTLQATLVVDSPVSCRTMFKN